MSCFGCGSRSNASRHDPANINARVVAVPSTSQTPRPSAPVLTKPQVSQAAPAAPAPPEPPVTIAEIEKVMAATDGLAPGVDSVIQADFEYTSRPWGSEEIFNLDKAAIRELLYKVIHDDQAAGFDTRDVSLRDGDKHSPPYAQLNSLGKGFRPYRIVKRQNGQLALYGHVALYRAKRELERAKNPSAKRSTEDLITELIDIRHTTGALLPPRGSELAKRIKSIGSTLNDAGGMDLMRQVHDAIRSKLGAVSARELEVAWDGVGPWLG